jgi:hypothetical protein
MRRKGILKWMLFSGFCLIQLLYAHPRSERHDFHVSITQIDHNAQAGTLEIAVKIFVDDLEGSIAALGGGKLHLGEPTQAANADSILFAYLENRLQVVVSDKPQKMTWVGNEIEADAVWCFLEIGQIKNISNIEITNRILMERFDDQANVVHVNANGKAKSLYLNSNHLNDRLTL